MDAKRLGACKDKLFGIIHKNRGQIERTAVRISSRCAAGRRGISQPETVSLCGAAILSGAAAANPETKEPPASAKRAAFRRFGRGRNSAAPLAPRRAQARSKRSAFITLVHAATKS
jgi:hypothetical protein